MKRKKSTVIANLQAHPLWTQKLEQDCNSQDVFLAIRDNAIDFYYHGGRLFRFEGTCFKTHIKYASVIIGNPDEYIKETQLPQRKLISDFIQEYERIKENCAAHYSVREAQGIATICSKHSYLSNEVIVVLDINISINNSKIDMLLYNKKTQTLKFVDVSHYSNNALRAGRGAGVINKISQYEQQIQSMKTGIIQKYANYVNIINRIFTLSLPIPVNLDDKVSLLIFDFDEDQRDGKLQQVTQNLASNGIPVYPIGNITKTNLNKL
jgi:hypothetical protein